ncbi:MAG: site-specific integrase [Thermoguttaceae bacterium]|nr:site-specific integrase [Thermoguttaceae bacterium]
MTLAELDLGGNPPTVRVLAAYAKNRREDIIPLPVEIASYIQSWLHQRPTLPGPGVRLWPGTWYQKAAHMIRLDLEAAGINVVNASGQPADFHALRSIYATQLARLGLNLQTAQALMRHSDPRLTARTYTKLGIVDLGRAVSRLAASFSGSDLTAEGRG